MRSFFTTFDVDYHDKNEWVNFEFLYGDEAPLSTMKNWFN